MKSLLFIALAVFSFQAYAIDVTCDLDQGKTLIVVESRGEQLSRELNLSLANEAVKKSSYGLCLAVAESINELRAEGYGYLECNVRHYPGQNVTILTVEKPNAGRWIWSSGVVNVAKLDEGVPILGNLQVCMQIVRYSNGF